MNSLLTPILASGSNTRSDMLHSAGVNHDVVPANIDEDALKSSMLREAYKPRDIADALAEMKAQKIAQRHSERIVIGSDQTLEFEGQLFDKPKTLSEAKSHLQTFRGKKHALHSAVVVFENAKPVFRSVETVNMYVRAFSDSFLEEYIQSQGDNLLNTVGCYIVEGEGVQLFDRIDGNYFAILGMPLLPLLGFLRTRELVLS